MDPQSTSHIVLRRNTADIYKASHLIIIAVDKIGNTWISSGLFSKKVLVQRNEWLCQGKLASEQTTRLLEQRSLER